MKPLLHIWEPGRQIPNRGDCPLSYPDPDLFEVTGDADEADFVVFPVWTEMLTNKRNHKNRFKDWIVQFEEFRKHSQKFVFFDFSDRYTDWGIRGIQFRASWHTHWLAGRKIYGLPITHIHSDLFDIADEIWERNNFKYRIGFTGYAYPKCRRQAVEALKKTFGQRAYIRTNKKFFQQYPEAHQRTLKRYMEECLSVCQMVLCPRGAGLGSQRLYETLACGRVPIIIADGYDLPFSWAVDWNSFSLRLPESSAFDFSMGKKIIQWQQRKDLGSIQERQLKAKTAWDEILHPKHVQTHIHHVLTKEIGCQ